MQLHLLFGGQKIWELSAQAQGGKKGLVSPQASAAPQTNLPPGEAWFPTS
jgi:hypothetical protein